MVWVLVAMETAKRPIAMGTCHALQTRGLVPKKEWRAGWRVEPRWAAQVPRVLPEDERWGERARRAPHHRDRKSSDFFHFLRAHFLSSVRCPVGSHRAQVFALPSGEEEREVLDRPDMPVICLGL